MEWLNNLLGPYAPLVTAGLAVFVPKLLSKFGITNPAITPTLPTPQVPTADRQLVEFEQWLNAVDAGTVKLDTEDVRILDRVAVRLAPKPAPTLPLGSPSGR